MSSLQLLELLEAKIGVPGVLTTGLRKLGKLRIEADHKILEPRSGEQNYSREFAEMCEEITGALGELSARLVRRRTEC